MIWILTVCVGYQQIALADKELRTHKLVCITLQSVQPDMDIFQS